MSDDSISLDDADWEVISDDWWHTPLSTAPCPLSWIDREPPQPRPRLRSAIAARNSHYWHEFLLLVTKRIQGARVCCPNCQEWRYMDGGGTFVCNAMKEAGDQGDLDLNPDLVGVKMVLAMVGEFERAVGITTMEHHTAGEIVTLARRVSQLLGNAHPVVNPKDCWDEYIATALDGDGMAPHGVAIYRPDLNADPPPADSITPILDLDLDLDLDPPRKKSRFSREVIDLTDSEQSVASEAPPATPKPERTFAAGGDGTMPGDLPKCHLIRVPSSPSISYSSFSPLTSDGLRSESSHTRCSSLPPGDLHKEDYDVEVVSESTPSEDADIPLFLVTSSDRPIKQHSRTRAIIDRLRSTDAPRGRVMTSNIRGSSNPSTPAKNPRVGLNNATVKQLFQKGSDGWIRLTDDAEHTASRAKVPSQVGPSDASRNPLEDSEPSESEEATPPVPKSTRDSRKRQAQGRQLRRGSGWVETPPSTTVAPAPATVTSTGPPRGAHGHRLAQSAQAAAPASVGTFTFPPPTYYAFPGQPASQYMPTPSFGPPPYQGFPPRGGGYPQTSLPFIGPPPHQHQQHQHPHPHQYQHQHQHPYPHPYLYQSNRVPYANAPVITGSTGIRHAEW